MPTVQLQWVGTLMTGMMEGSTADGPVAGDGGRRWETSQKTIGDNGYRQGFMPVFRQTSGLAVAGRQRLSVVQGVDRWWLGGRRLPRLAEKSPNDVSFSAFLALAMTCLLFSGDGELLLRSSKVRVNEGNGGYDLDVPEALVNRQRAPKSNCCPRSNAQHWYFLLVLRCRRGSWTAVVDQVCSGMTVTSVWRWRGSPEQCLQRGAPPFCFSCSQLPLLSITTGRLSLLAFPTAFHPFSASLSPPLPLP